MSLSAHIIDEIRDLPAQFPDVRTAVMPALDLAQEDIGYLTPESMSEVAAALNLDPGYVEGVATFYTLFHTAPVGKHRLYLCTNISCKLRGADELLEHAMKAVAVKDFDEVSADGLFSVEAVECLGACEYAPVMRLDHAYHHDLTAEKIDTLIAERRGDRPSPLRGEAESTRPSHLRGGGESTRPSPVRGEGQGEGLKPAGPREPLLEPPPPTKKPRAPRRKKAVDG